MASDRNMNREEIEKLYDEKALRRRQANLGFAERGGEFFGLDQAEIGEGVKIGAGTYIGPGTIITGASVIGEGCRIGQGCRIDNCVIGNGTEVEQSVMMDSSVGEESRIGPFAYIRPDSRIGSRCRIGDFVEVKNSSVGDDTKISHLSYIGDSDLGEGINIGCGVVFVNYDGSEKHRSRVGDGAFIGCNVNIVSPVVIGAGSYLAAGGTVTRDVPPGALHVARDRGNIVEGWVERRGLLKKRLEQK